MSGRADGTAESSATQLDSEPLTQYLARAGRLPILQGLALGVQLLWAVAQLHASGAMHGGLTSDRLLVTRTGRLVIPGPDEDAAMWPGASTDAGHEDDAASRPDVAGDIFAAAAVSYELLTGESPFPSIEAQRTWLAGGGEAPPPVHALREQLPLALDAVFTRALAARPEDRYRTAAELSAALQAAMPPAHWSRPSAVPRQAREETEPRPMGPLRGRKLAAAVAAGCAALAVLAATALWDGRPARLDVPVDTAVTEPQPTSLVEPVGESLQPAANSSPAPPAQGDAPIMEPRASARVAAPQPHESRRPSGRAAPPSAPVRHTPLRTARVASPPPDANCPGGLAFAPELCTVLRCATAEFRHHPMCVRMHAEGARARARLAETYGGP